ncbi:MAG TPA: CYTH and CHAD domain-containing protein [Kineosporiaceae bacterium]
METTFDVPRGFVLPELSGPGGIREIGGAREEHLEATYFDTDDLRLLRRGITLRRRTGGSDDGWHLKLPVPDDTPGGGARRDEVRLPDGRATRTVPPALAGRVSVHTRGQPLAPVVRLRTRRVERPVLGPDGQVLATIAEDRVSASAPAPDGSSTSVTAWSEIEVELVEGGPSLLTTIAGRLHDAGASTSAVPSKAARALADRLKELDAHHPAPEGSGTGPTVERPRAAGPVRAGRAGAVVLEHLAAHVRRLQNHDPLVRADEADAVHQMRVATRRLRSALATFRLLFDRTVTDPLREELRWLGSVLGAARDAEVIRDHLRAVVRAEPPDLVLGPVQSRIVTALGTRYRTAHDAVLAELDGARYYALLDALDQFLADPPVTAAAAGRPDDVLLPLVAKTWRRLCRLQAAIPPDDAARTDPVSGRDRRDAALHEVRKAAKRARYAAEALAARYGRSATRWARRMEAIQEALGAHQDTVVIRETLRELGVAAHLDDENAFSYGRLHALEQARGVATTQEFGAAWDRAAKAGLHRWLTR